MSRLAARTSLAVSALSAALTTGCIRDQFVQMAYPDPPPVSVSRDLPLTVAAVVTPSLLVAYEKPQEVGACLSQLAVDHQSLEALWSYGDCKASGASTETCLPRLPWFEAAAEPAPAPRWVLHHRCMAPPSSEQDRLQLALALNDAGVAAVELHLTALGPEALHAPMTPAVEQALSRAVQHSALLLFNDPVPYHDTSLPVLSLSGGAANGAFVAGYLYALLWLREMARAWSSPPQLALIERERFGGAYGTSVGTLIGLPLDLYFTDAPPDAAQQAALDACVKEGSGSVSGRPDRKLQDCALAKLERNFLANEWELLCAEEGTVLELAKPNARSLLRFDPLEQHVVRPFFDRFGSLTRGNAFSRTAMAVDLGQGVLIGLDERACRLPGMNATECDSDNVIASVSEPVFVPPRRRVFSGLRGASGEVGSWLDGGLTSVNPAARAVTATTGKVLALNTFRGLGTPTDAHGLSPIALGMVTTIGTGMIGWEVGYAAREQRDRRARACELGRLIGSSALCPPGPSRLGSVAAGSGGLLEVSVPEDIAPSVLFAAGYTFDPVVTRGLFLWGERALLRSRKETLQFLGWCVPAAMEGLGLACPGGEGANPGYASAVQLLEARVSNEIMSYARFERPGAWAEHVDARRDTVSKHMTTCR